MHKDHRDAPCDLQAPGNFMKTDPGSDFRSFKNSGSPEKFTSG